MRWCRSQKPAKSTASVFSIVTGCHPAVLWVTAQTMIGSLAVFCAAQSVIDLPIASALGAVVNKKRLDTGVTISP
jgi:hypothetical protein